MQQVYITGGSGFLGKRLIAALVARGARVVAMARSDAAAAAVSAVGATPARGDLDDRDAMTAAMRGCDTVFHAAARVEQHGPLAEFMAVNVVGTEHALAAARAAGVRRFVHIGTEAVLADGKPIVRADERLPQPGKPAGPYPFTKGLAETAVLEASGEGLETVVVRPRFIWGKGDTSVLPQIVDAVRRGRFGWLGGGRYLTSTCHVENVVEGALLAAERGKPGEIYFLTDAAARHPGRRRVERARRAALARPAGRRRDRVDEAPAGDPHRARAGRPRGHGRRQQGAPRARLSGQGDDRARARRDAPVGDARPVRRELVMSLADRDRADSAPDAAGAALAARR
jgi:nucleoside-diphosphate-sugar epimerase